MFYILKKSSKISTYILLIFLVCFNNNTYSKCCKKKHKKKNAMVSKIDSSNSYSPFPIYHDLGMSKEDSIKKSNMEYKQDLSYYIFLKNKKNPTQEYIDSLFNTGYKIDLDEYFHLKKIVEKEVNEKRNQKK